jgi:hypothetical protein
MGDLKVIDYLDRDDVKVEQHPTITNTKPLPEAFGRNLDTLEKARLWLTNPHNWHDSKLFIMKWNGLLCTVSRDHGERLLRETWDNGLPWCAVWEQKTRRNKSERGETMEEPETPATGEPPEA